MKKSRVMKVIEIVFKLTYYALVSFLFLTHTLFTQAVFANKDTLTDKILACSQVSDNKNRLTCFDALTNKDDVLIAVTSEPKLTKKQIDSFSKGHIKKTNEELAKEINTITLTISELSKNLYGKWNITFGNEQKWQQKDGITLNLKVGQRVVLTKGAFSAIYLQKENTNKRIQVKRLR